MRRAHKISSALLLALAIGTAVAQDSGSQQTSTPDQDNAQQPQTPAPAYGQETPPPPVTENPPISGLDLPGLEPHAAALSYLQPRAHVRETADSNVGNTLSGSSMRSVTSVLGGLDLQRLWKNYNLALDYTGGFGYSSLRTLGFRQVQLMDVDQKIVWKRGQLGIRDSFSYLPEGSFGEAYGGMNGLGELIGGGGFNAENVYFGGNIFGSLSQVPRIMNLALVDAVEEFTPKTAVTATVGYGFVHYTENISSTLLFGPNSTAVPISFVGSSQETGQLGIDHIFGPHDQAAIVYGYQHFDFSVSGAAFHTQIGELLWGHRISGRLSLLLGAGPQVTTIHQTAQTCSIFGITDLTQCGPNGGVILTTILDTTRLSAAGRASLSYKFPKTTVSLKYDHYTTGGSGFFAGAQSDIVRLSANRPLNRLWLATLDAGYSKNRRLQLPVNDIPGRTYDAGFAGIALHRHLGRQFHIFASYQFNELAFDSSFCMGGGNPGPCSRISQRHLGTIGLDWTPRPIHLD
ncbi:MAG TPA: hypothetical protein VMU61_06990 [Candidatus Aquilonibacter sp.]|nr:hypothetical protein [Candidatus Aquilonibacter sp.]